MVPGWVVARGIPPELLLGLDSGLYTLHGGVVRWAAGTANAGQIVRHLIPVDGFQVVQNSALKQLFTLAHRTMALSGLSLAVSATSFLVMNQKLNEINDRLVETQNFFKEVKDLLQRWERARLVNALKDLLKAEGMEDTEHRHTMLHNARVRLGEVVEQYADAFWTAGTIQGALAAEEYFCLAALARARCSAELRLFRVAQRELSDDKARWESANRRVVTDLFLGEHPERLLSGEYVEAAPVASIAAWMDFAHDDVRGYAWIDELRSRMKRPSRSTVDAPFQWFEGRRERQVRQQDEEVIPEVHRLMNRRAILDTYVEQYGLLEQAALRPSEFAGRLAALPEEDLVGGYLVLAPAA
jgi:hypothetical protein